MLNVDSNTATAFATWTLVIVGSWQVFGIRSEAKRERTLSVCNHYDSDPILDAARRKITQGTRDGKLQTSPQDFSNDAISILNYLDSIAIGIDQNVYVEKMVRDHLESILTGYVSQLLEPELAKSLEFNAADFSHLVALNKRWIVSYVPICWLGSDG
jgi:hypothetical protein